MAWSRERDGWGGKYTEHFDDDDNKTGESRQVDGWGGTYTEHIDTNYEKTGESRQVDGWGGTYTEHRDNNHTKTGESRDVDGWGGTYTEHRDNNHTKTGESRTILSFLFGRLTRHEGSGWLPRAPEAAKSHTPDAREHLRPESDATLSEPRADGRALSRSGSWFRWVGVVIGVVALWLAAELLARGIGPKTGLDIQALMPGPQVTRSPAPPGMPPLPGPLTARVKDDAGLLTPAERDRLERLLAAGQHRTKAQMVVALIESLQGEELEAYSLRVFNAWGVGRKDINDGVVLFVFMSDRQLRLEIGLGLQQAVPNAVAHQIITDILAPRFTAGEYYSGLEEAATAVYRRIEESQRPQG